MFQRLQKKFEKFKGAGKRTGELAGRRYGDFRREVLAPKAFGAGEILVLRSPD